MEIELDATLFHHSDETINTIGIINNHYINAIVCHPFKNTLDNKIIT